MPCLRSDQTSLEQAILGLISVRLGCGSPFECFRHSKHRYGRIRNWWGQPHQFGKSQISVEKWIFGVSGVHTVCGTLIHSFLGGKAFIWSFWIGGVDPTNLKSMSLVCLNAEMAVPNEASTQPNQLDALS